MSRCGDQKKNAGLRGTQDGNVQKIAETVYAA